MGQTVFQDNGQIFRFRHVEIFNAILFHGHCHFISGIVWLDMIEGTLDYYGLNAFEAIAGKIELKGHSQELLVRG